MSLSIHGAGASSTTSLQQGAGRALISPQQAQELGLDPNQVRQLGEMFQSPDANGAPLSPHEAQALGLSPDQVKRLGEMIGENQGSSGVDSTSSSSSAASAGEAPLPPELAHSLGLSPADVKELGQSFSGSSGSDSDVGAWLQQLGQGNLTALFT